MGKDYRRTLTVYILSELLMNTNGTSRRIGAERDRNRGAFGIEINLGINSEELFS